MPEMTKEERVLCALSREEGDRVPLYDLVSSVATIEHFGGETLTLENAGQVIPRAMSRWLDTTRVFLPGPLGVRAVRPIDEQRFTHERRDWFNERQIGAPYPEFVISITATISR